MHPLHSPLNFIRKDLGLQAISLDIKVIYFRTNILQKTKKTGAGPNPHQSASCLLLIILRNNQAYDCQHSPIPANDIILQIKPRIKSWVLRNFTKLFFNTKKLIILGNPVRTARCTSLDLTRINSHNDISNGCIFSLA